MEIYNLKHYEINCEQNNTVAFNGLQLERYINQECPDGHAKLT